MKILVTGGRSYGNWAKVSSTLDSVDGLAHAVTDVVQGGATGADALARKWGEHRGKKVHTEEANWYPDGKTLDRSAGHRRNAEMLIKHPDIELVVAFPGAAGTIGMVRMAKKKGIKVLEIT